MFVVWEFYFTDWQQFDESVASPHQLPYKQTNMDDSDDNGSDSEFKLNINTQYAENYEKWRAKEEYQKRKLFII